MVFFTFIENSNSRLKNYRNLFFRPAEREMLCSKRVYTPLIQISRDESQNAHPPIRQTLGNQNLHPSPPQPAAGVFFLLIIWDNYFKGKFVKNHEKLSQKVVSTENIDRLAAGFCEKKEPLKPAPRVENPAK